MSGAFYFGSLFCFGVFLRSLCLGLCALIPLLKVLCLVTYVMVMLCVSFLCSGWDVLGLVSGAFVKGFTFRALRVLISRTPTFFGPGNWGTRV